MRRAIASPFPSIDTRRMSRGSRSAIQRSARGAVAVIALLAFSAIRADAQETGRITGRVLNSGTLAPISTVQVFLVDTDWGTMTAENGQFVLLNIPAGTYEIRAERIGFASVTQGVVVTGGEAVPIEFQLEEEALGLDEIVVTGTAGQARRREVGNSISQIDYAAQLESPVNFEESLQAQVPGMTVLQSSAQLGSASQIRLRGNVSVSMSNQPLVYVDGVRMRSEPYPKNASAGESSNRSNNDVHSPLNDINPMDIERIEVIKGAAATTLYGTEAAAGVIQIFTKHGHTGDPVWTLQMDQGFDRMLPYAPEPAPYMYMEPWLRDAWRQKYNMNVRGGLQDLTYFVSGMYEDASGVLPNDELEKLSVRGNFAFNPIEDLFLEWNTHYSRTHIQNTPTGNNSHGLTLNVYRQERNYVNGVEEEDIEPLLDYDIDSNIDHFISGLTARYAPAGNFSNRLTVGYDLSHNELRQVRPYGFIRAPEGRMSVVRVRNQILTLDYLGNYEISLGDDFQTTVSWGGQSVTSDETTLDGYADDFPGPSEPTLSTGAFSQSFENRIRVINAGFFGQALFGYRDRYFLTTGVRIDGNSAFGQDFGLQAYPKASLSYVVSDESFWPDRLGQVKLRAAYGQSGRAPGAFDAVKTWSPVGWGGLPAYYPLSLGNPTLGPERTAETEVGFDGVFLGGRLAIDFTYYHQKTSDALLPVRQIPSLGFQQSQLENVGTLKNTGIEVVLNGTLLQRENFGWDLGLNVSTNHSEAVDLGGAPAFSLGNEGWVTEGHPVPVMRGVKILNPNEIAEPQLEMDYFFGPNQPTLIVGLHTRFQLPKGLVLAARGEYQGGHYINDGATSNAQSRAVISWPTCITARAAIEEGRYNELPALKRQRCVTENYLPATHIYPADFFKLREVSLRAPVPFRIPGTESATLTLSARNWYRWMNDEFPIFDPEMMENDGALGAVRAFNETLPPAATFTMSLRAVF